MRQPSNQPRGPTPQRHREMLVIAGLVIVASLAFAWSQPSR